MRNLSALLAAGVLSAACHDHTAPIAPPPLPASCSSTPITASGGGCWQWSGDLGLPVETIGAALTVKADGSISGTWVGRPAGCTDASCYHTGPTVNGATSKIIPPDSLAVQLSANNSNYSLTIRGRVSSEQLAGTATLFQNGKVSAAKPISLTRAH